MQNDTLTFAPGARVMHPSWGRGTVKPSREAGGVAALVAFDDGQTLMVPAAGLVASSAKVGRAPTPEADLTPAELDEVRAADAEAGLEGIFKWADARGHDVWGVLYRICRDLEENREAWKSAAVESGGR
ncbi:hypothetical protein [Sinomonas albida]|uniref:hypothetical protein n=1 Tax=Sinomonas albida TaxID=369942 RepID=UPI003017FB1A